MIKLTEVSRTVQTPPINGWVYRIEIEDFVVIKRVPENKQIWNHGIICQIFDGDSDRFVIASTANYRACSLHIPLNEAVKIIEKMVD